MRKLFASALIGLLTFTSPNGNPLWIVASQIVAVFPTPQGTCAGATTIITMYADLCVAEQPGDVVSKLEKAK